MKKTRRLRIILPALLALLLLCACGPKKNCLAEFPPQDMSGYAGLADYTKELSFVDVTVQDIHRLKEEKETFVFVASFANCPWCNAIIGYINDAALENKATVGLLDTRKDPSWTSNMDITDYDLFVEDFGDQLEYDEENLLHLYVPHIFFIKKGEVVYEHQGALPEMGDDPHMELTDEQKQALTEIFREGFRKL